MKERLKKVMRILLGIAVAAVGGVISMKTGLGAYPWDVLSLGINNVTGISVGKVLIMTGIVIVIINIQLDQRIGLGTVMDTIFLGLFIDIILKLDIIPNFKNPIIKFVMVFVAMTLIGLGTYLCMSAGLGSGPRDALMVGIVNATGKSVGFVKAAVEVTVVTIGYLLGAQVGIGTLILSLFSGYILEIIFKIFNFDVKSVKHEDLIDEFNFIKNILSESL